MATSQRIELGHFLKLMGIVRTGGEAKRLIQGGAIAVNGTLETQRRRKLALGDQVTLAGQIFEVGPSTD